MLHTPSPPPRIGAIVFFKQTALAAALFGTIAAGVQAQTITTPATTAADAAANERAKREGDKVFQWIRIHSDKPRKAAAPVASEKPAVATAPAPAAVKVVAKASNKPADSGITETVQPLPVPARSELASARSSAPPQEPVTPQVAAKTDASAPLMVSAKSPPVVVEEDMELTPTYRSEPDFPPGLMRSLRKGLVQVAFTVKPDGTVSEAHAVSSTHPRLVATAMATVAQWKFMPLRHAQQGVVDLGFNLD